jgi:hypothetical protein
MPEPPLEAQNTLDVDTQDVVTHCDEPIMAEGVNMEPPKLIPLSVKEAPFVVGRLVAASCEITGALNEKMPSLVPTTTPSVTKNFRLAPYPFASAPHRRYEDEIHDVEVQAVTVMRADGVLSRPPKLMPMSVMDAPTVLAAFAGMKKVTTGASKLKLCGRVPTMTPRVAVLVVSTPTPVGVRHTSEVSEFHWVDWQTENPS